MQSDFYPQEPRTFVVQAPIASSGTQTTTIRLSAQNINQFANATENITRIKMHNPGSTSISVQLVQAPSGPPPYGRVNIGSPYTIVPGGNVVASVNLYQPILEVASVGNDGSIRMDITSQYQWRELAFAKDDLLYPAKLWKANNVQSTASLNAQDGNTSTTPG